MQSTRQAISGATLTPVIVIILLSVIVVFTVTLVGKDVVDNAIVIFIDCGRVIQSTDLTSEYEGFFEIDVSTYIVDN
jgi:hypothetical protein